MTTLQSPSAFHGLFNIAGVAGNLARGERLLGYSAKSICFASRLGHESTDETIHGGLIQVPLLERSLDEFDVLNFHFGYSFLGQSLRDLGLLRARGRRIIMHFHGCDIRDSKRVQEQSSRSVCSHCWPHACNANRFLAREAAETVADGVTVSTPDLLQFVPRAIWLPQPVDIAAIAKAGVGDRAYAEPAPLSRRGMRIAHAPSSTKLKGSDYLIRAVDELQSEGHEIELDLLSNMSHALVLERIGRADVFVDQLLIGAYGVAAIEAMALGKPTVCYIREDVSTHYGPDCPIVNSDSSNLKQCLIDLIERRADWRKIGDRSRRYASSIHSLEAVSSLLRSIY